MIMQRARVSPETRVRKLKCRADSTNAHGYGRTRRPTRQPGMTPAVAATMNPTSPSLPSNFASLFLVRPSGLPPTLSFCRMNPQPSPTPTADPSTSPSQSHSSIAPPPRAANSQRIQCKLQPRQLQLHSISEFYTPCRSRCIFGFYAGDYSIVLSDRCKHR